MSLHPPDTNQTHLVNGDNLPQEVAKLERERAALARRLQELRAAAEANKGLKLVQPAPPLAPVLPQVEQDRELKQSEEALARRRARRSREDTQYGGRLLSDEEGREQHEGTRVARLPADNTEWPSHLIKQETDRIHAATIEDEFEGRLMVGESQWLENNIQKRKAEEERQNLKRAQEEEAKRLREAARMRAAQAEELAQAAVQERLALPPIPDPEEHALYSDPSEDEAIARFAPPRLPWESARRLSTASSESSRRMSTASTDEPDPTSTANAARGAWANSLRSEWDRRGAHEEHHHHEPHTRPAQCTPSFSYRYRSSSAEAIAATKALGIYSDPSTTIDEDKAFARLYATYPPKAQAEELTQTAREEYYRPETPHNPLVASGTQSENEPTIPSTHQIEGQKVSTDLSLQNQNALYDNSDQLVSHDAPISRTMTIPEVVSHLVAHGCQNLTDALNYTTFSQHPASHGGFSDVYRGHLLDATRVAVKALRISIHDIAENPKHLKASCLFCTPFDTLVDHTWWSSKLLLLGFAVFRDRIAMVSPWMGQGSLHRYLERTPDANRCSLCIQICEGLSHLHEIEIIHGDLKGANILISNDGTPVLTDFGNSIHTNQSMKFTQTTSERSWTMRWTAPELILGSGSQSKAADVYALAMTIYEVMTGILPYSGKQEHTIIYLVGIKKEPPERPDTIPFDHECGNKLWELLVRCWSFDPKARPSANETVTVMKMVDLGGSANSATLTAYDPN
ncbi:unnamed protein product [Rhizoctonia solani]|uniref:Protein kinase domain-containing protein n=1 Tax=Rhizoctonia solani TaxID=456999 RepID=A0A8H3DX06_9AGAM|nr:unnamed protein product [Rhizoctonia solani]